MPGFLANVTSTVACSHQGQAKPVQPNPRVTVMGQPTVFFTTTPADYTVAGCTFPPPSAGNGPCVSGKLVAGTMRVKSLGQPMVISNTTGTCLPTGTPLIIQITQTRVTAT